MDKCKPPDALTSRDKGSIYENGDAYLAALSAYECSEAWSVDSGVSYNMNSHRDWFCEYEKYDGERLISARASSWKGVAAIVSGLEALMDKTLGMLNDVHLEQTFWAEAVITARYLVWIRGRFGTRFVQGTTAGLWIHLDSSRDVILGQYGRFAVFIVLGRPLDKISSIRMGTIHINAAVNCILPKEWKGVRYGGSEGVVMLFDLDCRFDVLRLAHCLEYRIRGACGLGPHHSMYSKTDIRSNEQQGSQASSQLPLHQEDELFVSCMERFLYIRCHNSFEFLAALKIPLTRKGSESGEGILIPFEAEISTKKWKQGVRSMTCSGDACETEEERFYKLEADVASLSKDVGSISLSMGKLKSIMGLLMEKLGVPKEALGDHKEDTHVYEEEQPRANLTPPFKGVAKIEIQPYDGDVNVEKLDH
ncbi:hypothetical protein KI387_029372 [Taxus chinensis]|uniref:Uncharacterized protein n=1 Tax=Taxus chinensis TaxID=29808 RepID=A0AA38CCW4_TAXCH|nr:hypothetical protein KI387_029372 [Taxus chinensis]